MPEIEINGPKVIVTAKPARPTQFYITETVATTAGPDGEAIEVMRPVNNPFLLILRGAKNEAEIDLNSVVQEALLHVVQANDYIKKPDEGKANFRLDVSLLGSGHAAILLVDITDKNGTYTDVQQTGFGRYKTREEAVMEARMWSKSDGWPLVEGLADD